MFLINLILSFIMLIITKDPSYDAVQLLTMLIFSDLSLLLALCSASIGLNTLSVLLLITCIGLNISIAVPRMKPAWMELREAHKGIQEAILSFYIISFIVMICLAYILLSGMMKGGEQPPQQGAQQRRGVSPPQHRQDSTEVSV